MSMEVVGMSYGKISTKQQEILDYIKSEIINKGYPPAVREICEAVKLRSTSSVHSHLETLEKNGYIRRDPTKPRAIEIMQDSFNLSRREIINIPIIGTVTAGQPILAVENIDGYFPLLSDDMPHGETFMLNVKGESMINAGIYDGDKIIIKKQPIADNGDIIVALIEDSVTVKTFYKEKDYFRLQPENDNMDPIILKELDIVGKVVGLYRKFN
jgi:repressor LexA